MNGKSISRIQLQQLEQVANIIPTPLYWLDIDGTILGFNDVICNQLGGPAMRDKVLGKKHEDFYPPDVAKNLSENNKKVIESGQTIEFEEKVVNIITGEIKYYTAIRAPWRDEDGTIIGIIGTSIEITDKKEKERLALENERLIFENETQKVIFQEQEKFKKTVDQVVHDIRSPLASMRIIVQYCHDIPERERIALRCAATQINDIADNLLSTYSKKASGKSDHDTITATHTPLLVSPVLLQTLTEKKYQYEDFPVEFEHCFTQAGTFCWINAEPVAFKRMLSNIINNAVDAIKPKKGKVKLQLDADEGQVSITIEDNGQGMSSELVHKIMNQVVVTEGKKDGYGIGLTQARETLKNSEGKLLVESQVGVGTRIILAFPRIPSQDWLAETMQLKGDDIIVILDDDNSVHMAWDTRFDKRRKEHSRLTIMHFDKGQETINYINNLSSDEKQKVFLLTDYELIKQKVNGLDVITRTAIDRSILVTSHYANMSIRHGVITAGAKILPKHLACDIPIYISPPLPA